MAVSLHCVILVVEHLSLDVMRRDRVNRLARTCTQRSYLRMDLCKAFVCELKSMMRLKDFSKPLAHSDETGMISVRGLDCHGYHFSEIHPRPLGRLYSQSTRRTAKAFFGNEVTWLFQPNELEVLMIGMRKGMIVVRYSPLAGNCGRVSDQLPGLNAPTSRESKNVLITNIDKPMDLLRKPYQFSNIEHLCSFPSTEDK